MRCLDDLFNDLSTAGNGQTPKTVEEKSKGIPEPKKKMARNMEVTDVFNIN